MGDIDLRAARERIETVEKRIAALQDAGVDVGALRSQLAFAHGAQREGRLQDVEAICDEVLGAARRLAELGSRSSQPHPAIRTPAHGTQVPAETGTEAQRRVKVGRAQLAEEVRAAIDDVVKAQMATTPVAAPAAPAVDLSPLARRLDELAGRLTAIEDRTEPTPVAPVVDLSPLTSRLDELAGRLADVESRPPAVAPEPAAVDLSPITGRLDEIAGRLASVESRPVADDGSAHRLAALERQIGELASRPAPPLDTDAVAAVVSRVVSETVPRQASELLREAIAKLPTRDDLSQIADTLRADLDWRLEKAAAEHGWCSLADVQTSVRNAVAGQDPSPSGGSHLGRLETALAEFVQQSKDQQERLISALADRVAQHTKVLTKRMLVREPTGAVPRPGTEAARQDTEELVPSVSESGQGSSRMLAITGVAARASDAEASLDPVPAEALAATRQEHGYTTQFTARVPVVPGAQPGAEVDAAPQAIGAGEASAIAQAAIQPSDLQDLVSAEVERALSGSTASTMTDGAGTPSPDDQDTLPTQTPSPAMQATPLPAAVAAAPARSAPAGDHDLAVLIAAEVGRQLANTIPVQLPPSDADLARAVARILPTALQDETVRTELFAVLALEAAGKPGVLGELTGLRRFLKRELQAVAVQQAPVTVA